MLSERMQRRIESFLDQAEATSDAGDWTEVAPRARAVLAIDETNEDAQSFLKMAEANADSRARTSQADPATSGPVATAPAAPTFPSSFVSGRYAVRRLLGEGGRKRVYLAHDTRLDREVAFCVIRVKGWIRRDGNVSSVRRNPWHGWASTRTS